MIFTIISAVFWFWLPQTVSASDAYHEDIINHLSHASSPAVNVNDIQPLGALPFRKSEKSLAVEKHQRVEIGVVRGRNLNLVCTPGKYKISHNNGTTLECRACAKGRYTSISDMDGCKTCNQGRYASSSLGPGQCKECPEGKYQDKEVAAEYECSLCPDGYLFAGSGKPCTACPENTYFSDSLCVNCPSGFLSPPGEFAGLRCFPACVEGTEALCVMAKPNLTCLYGREYVHNLEGKQAECKYCSEIPGMDCWPPSENPPRLEEITPLQGYFKVDWVRLRSTDDGDVWVYGERTLAEPIIFKECPVHDACLPTGCINTTTGPLCALCEEEYYRFGNGEAECRPCSDNSPVVGIIVLVCIILVLLVLVYFFRKNSKRVTTANLRNAIRVCAISINFFQVSGSVETVIDIEWSGAYLTFINTFSFANIDLVEILGLKCLGHDFWNLRAKIIVSSSTILVAMLVIYAAHRCQYYLVWVRKKKDAHNLDSVRDRAALHLFETIDLDQNNSIDSDEFKFLLRVIHYDMASAKSGGNGRKRVVTAGKPQHYHKHLLHGVDAMSIEQIEIMMRRIGAAVLQTRQGRGVHQRNYSKLVLSKRKFLRALEDPYTMTVLGGDNWIIYGEEHRLRVKHLSLLLILCFSVLHAPVSRQLLSYFQCENIGGKYFIRADYSLLCQGTVWEDFGFFVGVVLLLYSIFLPLVISIQLCRHRNRLHSPGVRRKYGFLYDRFVVGAEFWEVFEVFRKVSIVGLVPFFHSSLTKALICVTISIFSLGLLLYFKPHRAHVVLRLEIIHFSSVVLMFLVLLYELAEDDNDHSHEAWMIFINVLFIVALLWTLVPLLIMNTCCRARDDKKELESANKSEHVIHPAGSPPPKVPLNLHTMVNKHIDKEKVKEECQKYDESFNARRDKVNKNMDNAHQRLQKRLQKRSESVTYNKVMAKAIHDFSGMHLSNIPLRQGDLVEVLGSDDQGWILVESNGESGQVPTSYLDFSVGQGEKTDRSSASE